MNDTTDLIAYSLEDYDVVKDIVDCHLIYKETGKSYNKDKTGTLFFKAFQLFKILKIDIGKLIRPMPLTGEIMHTQFYDKVDAYKTLDYTKNSYKQEKPEETINDIYDIFFGFETITTGEKHMLYLCWIYNDDLQHECVGLDAFAVGMLNALPTDKHEILLVAHNPDYGCIFTFEYLENVKPIVKGGRFLQIKATYYNPVKRNT